MKRDSKGYALKRLLVVTEAVFVMMFTFPAAIFAADEVTPETKDGAPYNVTYQLENLTYEGPDTIAAGEDLHVKLTAETGYGLPGEVQVFIDGELLDAGDYTYEINDPWGDEDLDDEDEDEDYDDEDEDFDDEDDEDVDDEDEDLDDEDDEDLDDEDDDENLDDDDDEDVDDEDDDDVDSDPTITGAADDEDEYIDEGSDDEDLGGDEYVDEDEDPADDEDLDDEEDVLDDEDEGLADEDEDLADEDQIDEELPEEDDEVVLSGYDDGWTFGDNPESIIGKTYTVATDGGFEHKVRVAGIVFIGNGDDRDSMYSENSMIYFSDSIINDVRRSMYASNSTTTMLINGSEENIYAGTGGLVVNENVPEGYILLPTSYDGMFKKGYAAGNEVELRAKALYYDEKLKLMIMGTYGEKTFERKTGLTNLADHDGEIYINDMDFRRLYEKGSFQASVFVDDTKNAEGMKDMLERGGYHVLVLKDHINNFMNEEIVSIIQLPMAVIICLAVFFIAYFVIRLILKSRGVYFATLRMLGMGKKPARRIMRIELVLDCMISYALFIVFVYLNRIGVVNISRLMDYITYLTVRDYVVLAFILIAMSVLISGRFMRSIFRSSAMGTYREEA